MDIFESVVAPRLVLILGVVNIVSGLAIFFTYCCIPGMNIGARLMKYAAYRRFYQFHCYIWWLFWGSVMVHAIFAIGFYGVPSLS